MAQLKFNRTQFWKAAAVALLLIPFIAGSFWAIYQNLTQGSTDLYPTWQGAKVFWEDGTSPYDDSVGEASQQAIYGGPATAEQDQFLFVYPFYNIFHIGPLALLNFKLAAAIYMELILLGLLLVPVLLFSVLRWLPSPQTLPVVLLWALISYFSVRGLLLAQPALPAYTLHMIALWSIYQGRNSWAGAALAFSTIKPQTGYLIIPLLLIWAWRSGRSRLVWAFCGVFGLMCGLSFLLEPGWLGDWIGQIRAYESYTETVPVAQIITHSIDSLPSILKSGAQVVLSALLLVPVFMFWRESLRGNQRGFLWGYFLTMLVGLMIVPRVATTYYLELYPVLYITAYFLEKHRQRLVLFLGGLTTLIGYWVLHIATVPPVEEQNAGAEASIVYVVFPVMVLGLLWYYRDAWFKLPIPADPAAQ